MFDSDFRKRLAKRFVKDKQSGCIFWTGWRNEKGYGRVYYKKQVFFVHRAAFMIAENRDLLPEEVVMHICNNPSCCNPDHLRVGTVQENNTYKLSQGRFYVNGKRPKHRRLNSEEVIKIKLRLNSGHGITKIARDYDMSTQCIRDIKNERTWSSVKLLPKKDIPFDPFED